MSFTLRFFWMLLGYAIVFTSLGMIFVDKPAFPSILDGVVWFTVALMIVARLVDVTRWQGMTVDGEPATLVHLRGYSVLVVSITAAAHAIVHALVR